MPIAIFAVVLVLAQLAADVRRVALVIGQNAYPRGASATVGVGMWRLIAIWLVAVVCSSTFGWAGPHRGMQDVWVGWSQG